MRRALVSLAVLGLVPLSGCLPERDNPFDRGLAPAAQLVLRDNGPENEQRGCPTDLLPGAAPAFTLSRGRCVVFDALGTKDPQGSAVSYTFLVLDTAGAVFEDVVPEPFANDATKATLSYDARRSLPVDVTLIARVIAKDPGGVA